MLRAVKIVNVHEAKTHLSRLLADVAAAEEVVIAKAGTLVVMTSVAHFSVCAVNVVRP